MKLKFLDTIIDSQNTAAKISAIAWSPDNKKLAVATKNRHIYLYDGNRELKDSFSAKPCESKYGKNSFLITAMAFSPDSTKLAVGQSDKIVFVYKLGKHWDEKKVITNRFPQKAAVTSLIWPTEHRLVVGVIDGTVRFASCKSDGISTEYRSEHPVISLAKHPVKKVFVSGHLDGSIIIYSFETKQKNKIITHTTPPFVLLLTNFGLIVSGCDQRIMCYSEEGRLLQTFDHTKDPSEKEYVAGDVDPSGMSVVLGSFDRLRLMLWNPKRGAWDEGNVIDIGGLYTISAVDWKPDGSTIVVGSLSGSVIAIDCSLKKTLLKNQFEVTYVSPSQIVVKDPMNPAQNPVGVRSVKGYNIRDIRIMGRSNRYLMAYTTNTLLLSDMETGRCSEIPWESAGNEKFIMEYENCCMIVNAGEINIVEYGIDNIIGWIRTEITNPHLLSIRLNERKSQSSGNTKVVAYLVDYFNIHILNLVDNTSIEHISHNTTIDWLELNETGTKLLYRDTKSRVQLFEFEGKRITSLIDYCTYIQWVPESDVVVAQSEENLCVWYSTNKPDQVTIIPIKGDVEAVQRTDRKTEVIVSEGSMKAAYELDNTLIEFGTAMYDFNFNRAIHFLENNEYNGSLEMVPMWRQLSTAALEEERFSVSQRAFAALKNFCKVDYLSQLILTAEESSEKYDDYKVKAKLCVLNGKYKQAEKCYLAGNDLEGAIDMYLSLHKWDTAMELARAMNYTKLELLRQSYYKNLTEMGQEQKIAEIKEMEGDYRAAIQLYLKANSSPKAARILLENGDLLNDEVLFNNVLNGLKKNNNYEKIGEMYEKQNLVEPAMNNYKEGKAFSRAVRLAKTNFPHEVVPLEIEWANYLVTEGKHSEAIGHFVEAGDNGKALDSAMAAKDWPRAIEIIKTLSPTPETAEYYFRIGEYYESIGKHDQAENYYLEAERPLEAIEMYNKAQNWTAAHRLASEFMQSEETEDMYLKKADDLEKIGEFKKAEELYISIGLPVRAITMYKDANKIFEMMALVQKYHPDRLDETRKRIAEELEEKGDLKSAEEQYLIAGDWKSAVEMYISCGEWVDAYRIARNEGNDFAGKNVAYLWAKSLGGDSAVRLLQKYNILNETITMAFEKHDFDFAFEVCRLGAKNRLPEVYEHLADHLDSEGHHDEAAANYIQANKPDDAVKMYVRANLWDDAEKVAKQYNTESLKDVFIGQAQNAVMEKDFFRAETYLLRAEKPDLILKYYKANEMWDEALRIAHDYLPMQLNDLQKEYDIVQLKSGAKGALSYISQGKDYEDNGEYLNAVNTYMKVRPPVTENEDLIMNSLKKAAELTIKFIPGANGLVILGEITKTLNQLGLYIDAAEVFLASNRPSEAIDALLQAQEWSKAKRIATELLPEAEGRVDMAYRDFLKNAGNINELIGVDVISAITLLVEKGNWEKALDIASKQNHQPLVDKYVAMYVGELLEINDYPRAIRVFERYGAASNPQNINIYRKLIDLTISDHQSFEVMSSLRNMLFALNTNMKTNPNNNGPVILTMFEKYLEIMHFLCLGYALDEFHSDDVNNIKLKLKITLLRYIDLIPADKVFYEAGVACKHAGPDYINMAFTFLGQWMDIVDAIETNDPSVVDNDIFEGTDVPMHYPIPQRAALTEDQDFDVREWVLAGAIDKNYGREIKKDKRFLFEASLSDGIGKTEDMCVISGYPVLGGSKDLGNNLKADSESWHTYTTISKTHPTDMLRDIQNFLSKWAGKNVSML
uniref:WD_REPEATS_REGION domain-containing protein n=1 Tax=Rhabditophanes sp. KR3021 TaxID=114890 RepID=A0AC35U6D2_9BILA